MTELGYGALYKHKSGEISKGKRRSILYHETKQIFEALLETPSLIIGYQGLASFGGSIEQGNNFFEEIRIRLSIMRIRQALRRIDKRLAKKVKSHYGSGYSWG